MVTVGKFYIFLLSYNPTRLDCCVNYYWSALSYNQIEIKINKFYESVPFVGTGDLSILLIAS